MYINCTFNGGVFRLPKVSEQTLLLVVFDSVASSLRTSSWLRGDSGMTVTLELLGSFAAESDCSMISSAVVSVR